MDPKAVVYGAMPWGSSSASPVPHLPCHAMLLLSCFVSSWSCSPKTRQLLLVQAFARGGKAWGAWQGYMCHTIP